MSQKTTAAILALFLLMLTLVIVATAMLPASLR
jgi:hypothetical protein